MLIARLTTPRGVIIEVHEPDVVVLDTEAEEVPARGPTLAPLVRCLPDNVRRLPERRSA